MYIHHRADSLRLRARLVSALARKEAAAIFRQGSQRSQLIDRTSGVGSRIADQRIESSILSGLNVTSRGGTNPLRTESIG